MRGQIRIAQADAIRALEDFNAAIDRNQDNQLAYRERAVLLFEMGELTQAKADCSKVLKLDQSATYFVALRATILAEEQSFIAAEDLLDQHRERHPLDEALQFGAGWVAIEKGDYKKAIGLFQTIIARSPDNINAKWNLAYAYRLSGEHTRATPLASELAEISATNFQEYGVRGYARAVVGRPAEALADGKQAIAARPWNRAPYFDLALIHSILVARMAQSDPEREKAIEAAIDNLDAAISRKLRTPLANHPDLKPLQSSKRFQELLD